MSSSSSLGHQTHHSSASLAHFIEQLPCMSRGATSAASMEFSGDRRCKCTSLRLHRSASAPAIKGVFPK
ncbi:hypothetical protein L3X38_012376 [Prunus dulcis]|uniref:Uncharacterized protein n=1 Tax=Prunus dulcis TaxID=3755 RepID=A0AAD4ZG02_PRUDU|nr:hypothetical protein L3X38_012376 [Prunus dulcis]